MNLTKKETARVAAKDPNDYIGSVFVWHEENVKEIMQDIVNFTKQNDNNIRWK